MNIKSINPLLEVTFSALFLFVLHKLYFFLLGSETDTFYFSIEVVYGFFFAASLTIIVILMLIKKKNIDSVGFVFLLITSLKIVISYFLLRKIIINEIGVMRMCEENQGVLNVIEAYDFKGRLWIFVELMDDALTSFV